MPVRRLHKLPFLCLLVLCLLISPVSSFGYVWCVGDDGHAALEAALAGDCAISEQASTADSLPIPGFAAGDKDCGSCLDVSPSYRWGSSRTRQEDVSASLSADLAPASIVARILSPAQFLNPHYVADYPPRIPEPILLHRTTVLLI